MPVPTDSPTLPGLSRPKLILLLAHETRWALLFTMAAGEALPVSELARRVRRSFDHTRQHLEVMRRLGVVVNAYGKLKRLAPAFLPAAGAEALDFGPIQLRLPTGAGTEPA